MESLWIPAIDPVLALAEAHDQSDLIVFAILYYIGNGISLLGAETISGRFAIDE